MDLLADLTDPQREAVSHREGPLLVLAGAGSGKTRVITRRVANLLNHGVPGFSILALTFTNKAAGEMRERIEHLAPRSGVWVGTFHGLCARLLRQYADRVGLDRGFSIYDQSDRLKTVKGVMESLGMDGCGVTPEQVEGAISRAKNDMMGPEQYERDGRGDHVGSVAAKVYAEYQKRMLKNSAVDFDDLLVHVVALVRHHPDLRARLDARFQYILVDEYQDTNLAQYAIVRGLSIDSQNLCVTGDPDQSIYGWRGANLGNILEFEQDFPGCKVVRLEQNYRSTKNILRVADHLIRFNKRRKSKQLATDNPTGIPVSVIRYPNEVDEAKAVASRIGSLVKSGEYSLRDIAVFVRTGAQTRPLEAEFRYAKIPHKIVGGVSFYARQEIKDLLAYLNLVVNPRDDIAFTRIVNVPPRGIGATTVERLAAHAQRLGLSLIEAAREAGNIAGIKDRPARALRDFVMLMSELITIRNKTAEESIRQLLAISGLNKHLDELAAGGEDERRAYVEEMITVARNFDSDHPGASLSDFLEEVTLSSAVDRWDDDGGSVALMTLHAAKGLEFPVVFLVGLEQGLLPHSRSAENDAQLEEERRLLFVGITRARKELYLSHCQLRDFRGSRTVAIPSIFLSELPQDESVEWSDRTDSSPSYSGRARLALEPTPRPSSSGFKLVTAADLNRVAAPAPSGHETNWTIGMVVMHPEYGPGRITALEGMGSNRKAKIAFTVGGERTFLLARTPLRPLSSRKS